MRSQEEPVGFFVLARAAAFEGVRFIQGFLGIILPNVCPIESVEDPAAAYALFPLKWNENKHLFKFECPCYAQNKAG